MAVYCPEAYTVAMKNKKNGAWIVRSSKQIYKNPWIEVVEDQVIRPDGLDGIYGTIRIKSGVSVLPIDDNNNVYLINEFKYPLSKTSIETVAGGIEAGRTALQAAQSELKEEWGITAKEWIDLKVVHPITSFIDSPNYLFIARKLKFAERKLEGGEQIDALKLPLAEAAQMVMDGHITEQKSCCLILKAARLLNV